MDILYSKINIPNLNFKKAIFKKFEYQISNSLVFDFQYRISILWKFDIQMWKSPRVTFKFKAKMIFYKV